LLLHVADALTVLGVQTNALVGRLGEKKYKTTRFEATGRACCETQADTHTANTNAAVSVGRSTLWGALKKASHARA
jgi:hypothetical protein